MNKETVLMFSGQGSQYYQMGKTLFNTNKTFKQWFERGDKIAQSLIGKSLISELYNTPQASTFDDILVTHPAIFLLEYSVFQVLLDLGIRPAVVLGASLGEFTAACAANVLSFEKTLVAVIEQAKIIHHHCEKGGMIAVFDDKNTYDSSKELYENTSLASINFNRHFVISETSSKIDRAESYLKKNQYSFQKLPVSIGFHSSAIDEAERYYKEHLNRLEFSTPQVSYMSCSEGNLIQSVSCDHFWNTIKKPILFQHTIQSLENRSGYIYIDLSPSGTLATFVKYILSEGSRSEFYSIVTPFHQELKKLDCIKQLLV